MSDLNIMFSCHQGGRKASPEEQPKAVEEMTAQSKVYGNSPPDYREQTSSPGT